MRFWRRFRLTWRATGAILALLALLLAGIVAASSPIPVIDQRFGDASLHFSADRAWALLPGDCVKLRWQVEGIESLHVEGRGEIGYGEKAFCPGINDKAARFAVRTPDGLTREYDLRLHFLPDLLLYLAGFVGVASSLALMAQAVMTNRLDRALNSRWLAIGFASLVVVGIALRLNEPHPPRLDADDGQVKVAMWAEKSSLVYPHESADVFVSVAGAESLRLNGKSLALKDGLARASHNDRHGSRARLELVGADGAAREYALSLFAPWTGLAHLPFYVYLSLTAWLALAALGLPIVAEKARTAWRHGNWTDLLPLLAFAWLVLMLFAPFGLDGPPQRERWELAYYADSGITAFSEEYRIRPFIRLPSAPAVFIDSESFRGFHIVQYAIFTLWMSLCYGILRKLGVRRLYAFLIATLFFLYPVNDSITSLRNLTTVTSVLLLLIASWLALDYLEGPRRLTLAGALLALAVAVESYEAGLVLIAALPFFLWLRRSEINWRRVNLALLFCCASGLKVGHTILNYLTGRGFYQDQFLDPNTHLGARLVGQNPLQTFATVMSRLYADTFAGGWQEALESLGANQWLLPMGLGLLGVGAVALVLWRAGGIAASRRGARMGLLGGLLWIMPAAGVLVWAPAYQLDVDRRLAIYTGIGGAIAVFCLLLLVMRRISGQRLRDGALILLCMALFLPALSRLFVQRDHWTRSAWKKADILRQVVELAPRPTPGVHLVLMNDMPLAELTEASVGELAHGTVFKSALRLIYQQRAPGSIFFCWVDGVCGIPRNDAIRFDPQEPGDYLRDTLVFALNRDLSVELVDDPIALYGWDIEDIDIDYDANRLFDADAPLPPRAHTMLGISLDPAVESGQTPLSPPVESGQTPLSPPVESGGG